MEIDLSTVRDDPYLWWDVLRIIIAATAFWLAALLVRFGLIQWRAEQRGRGLDGAVHSFTYASFALALITIAARRVNKLYEPPDVWLWLSIATVALGLVGVLQRVRVGRPGTRR